jgi:hypothetical protein
MTDRGFARVYHELGLFGIAWKEVRRLMNEAMSLASAEHQMGAKGRVPIRGTKRVLVYNSGIDGLDATWSIEDENPEVHVDWRMTAAEWEELRSVLIGHGGTSAYVNSLYLSGKLGPHAPEMKH